MFIFSDKMKAMPPIKRISRIGLSLAVVILSVVNTIYGQTSRWNGSSWDNGAPSSSTASYTFIVDSSGCVINVDASMTTLTINPGADCTISSTVNSTNVILPYDDVSQLTVDGTLNVTNLQNISYITGIGSINISAGNYSQTDGTHYGSSNVYNFNVLSGSISLSGYFSFQNMTISQGATVTISYSNKTANPSVNGTLTLNGTLVNNYKYSDVSVRPNIYYYFTIGNLLINTTGSYNSSGGYSQITQSFKIGGSIAKAGDVHSYNYNFNNSPSQTNNVLEVFGNANFNFTDLTTSSSSYKYLGSLKVYNGGKFTIDKSITIYNSLTINANGNIVTSGTPTLTVNTSIDPIAGRLILLGATLNYTPTTLTLNGTNAALAYLNKPNYYVTLSGGTDTITNCTFQKLVVNSAANGIVSNNSAYRIQRIDAAGPVTIASLLKNDTIKIYSGSAVLTGSTRVAHMVDIAAGASLTSNGNLTMLDGSNLYFAADGQIIGNIKWHRKYGSTGWVYMGVPFPKLTRVLVGSGGISQQTIYMNEYDESKVSPRWSAVGTTDTLVVGKGYNLAMGTITNDTLVFTGNPRLQTVSLPVTYSYSNGSQFDSQRGYNLVSNPFTAPISVSGFFADNPHLNKIYCWDNQGGGKGVYVMRTYNKTDGTSVFTPQLSSVTAKNQTKISASYLAPNQGFFIKLDSADYASTPSLVFNPSSVTKDLNDNFLKDAPVLLRLNAKNTSGTQNDIVFQFNNSATSEINPDLDFSKLVSDTYPLEIYSFKKGSKFSIQTVKVDTTTRIPIGLVIKNNEKHSIWVDNFDALPAGVDIFIHDKLTDRSVNLKDSAFTGGLSAGTYDNRFEVVFKDISTASSTSDLESKSTSEVAIRSLNGQVYADFKTEQKNVAIQVFDISGRVIYEKRVNWVQGSVMLDTDFSSTKVYLIKITGNQLFRVIKFLML